MNTTALRALILCANVGLLGLVGWTSYLTFFYLDPAQLTVDAPDLERYRPPALDDDPLRGKQDVYLRIAEVFKQPDPEPDAPAQPPGPPQPPTPPLAGVENLKVAMSIYDPSAPERSSVWLATPRNEKHTFTVGMELSVYPAFAAYKDYKIREITEQEIVLEGKDGKTVRLSAKPGGRAMKATGIDIGISGIKICVLDGSAKRPRVLAFVDHPLEQTSRSMEPESIGRLLERLIERLKLPTDHVVASVPLASCLVREIQVPFTKDDQIAKTIKFQAESAFHSIQIDDMLVDHVKVEEAEGRSRLIVVAYRKDAMEDRLAALTSAGLDPAAMDLDVAALYNTFLLSDAGRSGARTLLVDLGKSSLKVVVIEDGRIQALRSLRANAAEVKVEEKRSARTPRTLDELRDDLLAEEREDTFFAEDEGRLPVVILDEEQSQLFDFDLEETRQSVLEKIFFEIDRTLARTLLLGPIEQVILTGGGSEAKGITEAFAEHFEVDARTLEPAGVGLSKLKKEQRAALRTVGGTALGLALKGLGVDAAGFDLRKEEYAFAGTFERLKSGLACSLVLLFVLFFLVAYRYQIVETGNLYTKQQRIQLYQREVFRAVFAEDPGRGSVYTNLKNREAGMKRRLGQDVPDVVSTLDMLRDVAAAAKASGREFKLKVVSLNQKQVSIVLAIDKRNDVYDLKEKLNSGDYLVSIKAERITEDPKTSELEATLTLQVKEPERKGPGVRPRVGG